jgi:cell division protein FtsQ
VKPATIISNLYPSTPIARKQAKLLLVLSQYRNAPWLRPLSILGLLASLMVSVALWLSSPHALPIKKIRMSGYINTSPEQLLATLNSLIKGGLFNLDLAVIQSTLNQLPWITAVQVHRQWPNQLNIQIQERQALASWQSLGTVSPSKHPTFIDSDGQLFTISATALSNQTNKIKEKLPIFIGLDSYRYRMVQYHAQASAYMQAVGLSIKTFSCNAREACHLVLGNGIKLLLGRNSNPVQLQRFVASYPRISNTQTSPIVYVDLRYTNGMAVQLATSG